MCVERELFPPIIFHLFSFATISPTYKVWPLGLRVAIQSATLNVVLSRKQHENNLMMTIVKIEYSQRL